MNRFKQLLIVGISLGVALVVAIILGVLPASEANQARVSQEAMEAEAARYAGLAEETTGGQAREAETARYTGLAESYAEKTSDVQRGRAAETARYSGLAESDTSITGDSRLLAENPELMIVQLSAIINRTSQSEFLAENPEVHMASRYGSETSQAPSKTELIQRNGLANEAAAIRYNEGRYRHVSLKDLLRANEAVSARYTGLAESYTGITGDSRLLAENPELSIARRYEPVVKVTRILPPGH